MFSVFLQYLFLLSSFPLARWVLPHIKSRKNSLIIHISIGLIACSLLYRIRILFAFLMVIVGYYLIDKNPYFAFIISFLMHMSVNLLQFYIPVHLKVKNLTKILFYKIVATSFNYSDGRKINTKEKDFTSHQKTCFLTVKPTFYEWLAYCFTPFGSISPSFYEFRLFESILDIGRNQRKVSDESRKKALKCLIESFIEFAIYYTFRHTFNLAFYQSEFFISLNISLRILLVLFLGIIIYSRFFMLWKTVDAGLYEVGVFDNSIFSEDEFTSLSLPNLLSQSTIKDYGKAFNHTNGIFWSNYFTMRGKEAGISDSIVNILSRIVKPLTIGLYGVFFISPIEKKLYSFAEMFVPTIAAYFTSDSFWPCYIFTQIFMIASRSSVRFKSIYAFYYVNHVVYFVFWIAAVLIIIVGFFVKKFGYVESQSVEKKKEEEQHTKKD